MRDTAHLTLAEHGVYALLLDHYYSTGGPLPDSMDALIRICRAYEDAEKRAVESVAGQYFPVNGDGKRHNKRADDELVKASDKSEKARRSAAVRWENDSNANAMRTHKRTQCSPHPHPHPHPEVTNQKPEGDVSPTPQADAGPPVITIPIIGGGEYPITQDMADEWESLYPAVDIMQTLREIRGWNLSNAKRRKTKSGVLKHVNSWLAKEQNGGR